RVHHLRHELQQRRLALPVAPDHADRLAGLHLEAHVAQRPELAGPGAAVASCEQVFEAAPRRAVALETDAGIRHRDHGSRIRQRGGGGGRHLGHQISFSTVRIVRWYTASPTMNASTLMPALTATANQSSCSGKNAARYRVKMPASGLKEPQKSSPMAARSLSP